MRNGLIAVATIALACLVSAFARADQTSSPPEQGVLFAFTDQDPNNHTVSKPLLLLSLDRAIGKCRSGSVLVGLPGATRYAAEACVVEREANALVLSLRLSFSKMSGDTSTEQKVFLSTRLSAGKPTSVCEVVASDGSKVETTVTLK